MKSRVSVPLACIAALTACGGGNIGGTAYVPKAAQNTAPFFRHSAIKSGDYLYLGFQRTDLGTGNDVIIAAVPTTASGKVAPAYTITATLDANAGFSPCGAEIHNLAASSGRIYLLDDYSPNNNNQCGSSVSEIRVYSIRSQGQAKPERLITGTRTMLNGGKFFAGPTGSMAIGDDGTLYAGYGGGIYAKLSSPGMLAFAPTANGNASPARTVLLRTRTGYSKGSLAAEADSIALDATGRVFDVDHASTGQFSCADLQAVPPNSSGLAKPTLQFLPGLSANYSTSPPPANSFAIYGTKAYILYDNGEQLHKPVGGVAIYDLSGSSVQPPCAPFTLPSALISGNRTKITNPYGIAMDAKGYLYVFNEGTYTPSGHKVPDGTNSVYVFAPGASGNVAPIRSITVVIPNAQTCLSGFCPFTIGRVP